MVSLWEFEWEEVQERGRWEVGEVEVGRWRESREVATASPLSVHLTDMEEALTCVQDCSSMSFTWVQNRFGGLLQFGLTFGHGDGNWSMFNPLLQWFSLNQFETSTPCNVQTKAGGGSEGDEEQDASSLHNRHRYYYYYWHRRAVLLEEVLTDCNTETSILPSYHL